VMLKARKSSLSSIECLVDYSLADETVGLQVYEAGHLRPSSKQDRHVPAGHNKGFGQDGLRSQTGTRRVGGEDEEARRWFVKACVPLGSLRFS
jgi:hypothetical protein